MYLHHLEAVIARLHPEIQHVRVSPVKGDRDALLVTITTDLNAMPAIEIRLAQAKASGQYIGLPDLQLWELYYTILLKDLGCSSNAYKTRQRNLRFTGFKTISKEHRSE